MYINILWYLESTWCSLECMWEVTSFLRSEEKKKKTNLQEKDQEGIKGEEDKSIERTDVEMKNSKGFGGKKKRGSHDIPPLFYSDEEYYILLGHWANRQAPKQTGTEKKK